MDAKQERVLLVHALGGEKKLGLENIVDEVERHANVRVRLGGRLRFHVPWGDQVPINQLLWHFPTPLLRLILLPMLRSKTNASWLQ